MDRYRDHNLIPLSKSVYKKRKKLTSIKLSLRRKIYDRDNGMCYLCGMEIKFFSQATVDHVIPKSKGGTNDKSNLKITHSSCNNFKGNKTLDEIDLEKLKKYAKQFKGN